MKPLKNLRFTQDYVDGCHVRAVVAAPIFAQSCTLARDLSTLHSPFRVMHTASTRQPIITLPPFTGCGNATDIYTDMFFVTLQPGQFPGW